MPDVDPWRAAPELPATPTPSPSSRPWTMLRVLRWRRWLRPRRIGCLLVLLMVLGGAALWVLDRVVDVFRDHPVSVAGSPFDTVAPQRPASSGSPTLDRIIQRGKLIVAIQEAPGLAQRSPDSGAYTGFDIALLGFIARDLGVDPAATTFKPLTAGSREAAVGRGEADLVLGGYEITPQRGHEVGVAGPYLTRPLRLAVPATSPVTGPDSLAPGEVCVQAASPAAAALVARGVGLHTRPTLESCVPLLKGRVAAIAGDQAAVAAVLAKAPGTLRMVGEPLGTTEYGIGLPPGDHKLRERITAVLRRAIDDGTWARLYAEYLGTPVPSPPSLR
ncbi:MAG TPA: transporter substrate-binding domain-containing protein [Pseudonocardiaceae bacterium]|nr:transporter substrate-binding domain-containing protein [Pseudonocardiaceae bacterium]